MVGWILLKSLLLPPGNQVATALLGGLLRLRWPRLGGALILFSLLSLYLLSIPFVATQLAFSLEQQSSPVTPEGLSKAQLLVVLGGGRQPAAPEYDGRDRPSVLATERLLYAAFLARRSGLELLVTGGVVEGWEEESEAQLMTRLLQQELGVRVLWQEGASRTTHENAINSRALLPDSIQRIALVTHALHMPRARRAFERAGFEVIPAPLGYHRLNPAQPALLHWLPSVRSLLLSRDALHEWLGGSWYDLRARLRSPF
ncbi:YdcF family protein [Aestuariirhabdus litorea]|uniref:YdcF family protein n=1 Tax=Aestuariirhabdus litorea TaxID=2528527 RepID=A0A3P3VMK9_9GAMM|nr:YdcF family protein [Aestuariirhabdus litorea]RRJ83577.1 YdcF family protein [Aestuariirhabdus litorea]RWW96798.1 YdcF family protein [Endozoicomonadaceae bacterium GTF-13]